MYLNYATANTLLQSEGITDFIDDSDVSIRKAQRALDSRYGRSYMSDIVSVTQTDLWPRVAFIGRNGKQYDAVVPEEIKLATAILAYNIQNDISLDVVVSSVRTEKTKVGEIESHIVYGGGGNTVVPDVWRTIDSIIWPLLIDNNTWRLSL